MLETIHPFGWIFWDVFAEHSKKKHGVAGVSQKHHSEDATILFFLIGGRKPIKSVKECRLEIQWVHGEGKMKSLQWKKRYKNIEQIRKKQLTSSQTTKPQFFLLFWGWVSKKRCIKRKNVISEHHICFCFTSPPLPTMGRWDWKLALSYVPKTGSRKARKQLFSITLVLTGTSYLNTATWICQP